MHNLQKLAKTWIYFTPYVCTERIFDDLPLIYNKIFLKIWYRLAALAVYKIRMRSWRHIWTWLDSLNTWNRQKFFVLSRYTAAVCLTNIYFFSPNKVWTNTLVRIKNPREIVVIFKYNTSRSITLIQFTIALTLFCRVCNFQTF